MDYSEFVDSVMKQDSRNILEKTSRRISDLPEQLSDFYSQLEPRDVAIVLNDLTTVVLYPYQHLHKLQKEYNLGKSYFVFATRNSDPIAMFNQQVVTLAHGLHNPEVEVMTKSFNDYIKQLIANIRF